MDRISHSGVTKNAGRLINVLAENYGKLRKVTKDEIVMDRWQIPWIGHLWLTEKVD